MAPLASPDLDLELVTLEALDFPIQCAHNNHNDPGWQHHHGGPATHWLYALHYCCPGLREYPACEKFTQHVRDMTDRTWVCPRCKAAEPGRDMVRIVGAIS